MPWLILLGVTLVSTSLVTAGLAELRILTSELVHQRAMDQLLEVTTAVELEAFEDPTFHDRIRLAREHADTYAWEVVWGLVTLMTTAFTSVAVVLVLLSVAPLLVPVALVAFVPIAFVSVRNTKALYRLHYDLAESDRDRTYHERLLTDRLEAREVRAFGLAGLAACPPRCAVRRTGTQHPTGRQAAHGSGARSARRSRRRSWSASLAVVMLFALDDRISVADAAIAVVALQQLSSRLRSSGGAMESLVAGGDVPARLRDLPGAAAGDHGAVRRRRQSAPAPSEIALQGVGYRYPAGTDDVLDDIDLDDPAGPGRRHRRPQRRRQEHAREAAVRPAAADVGPDLLGRRRHRRSTRPRASGRHVTPVFQDFTRFEHSAREAIGFGDIDRLDDDDRDPPGRTTRRSRRVHRSTPRRVRHPAVDVVHRRHRTLRRPVAAGGDRPGLLPRRTAGGDGRAGRRARRPTPNAICSNASTSSVGTAWCVFISHRFATVRRADQILVLLDGRVAERGTHDELMALGAVYAELYTIQAEQFG